jgi:hypothetical protein
MSLAGQGSYTVRMSLIQARAYNVIDRVISGQPVEDDGVELKAEWLVDVGRAARRIAAHANASHGEPILWLVGVDEGARSVPGVLAVELAEWLPAVEAEFNEVAPAIQVVTVPYEGVTVMALHIETDAAPYMVKVKAAGPVDREVPYRDGTRTRSASRSEVVRMLAPVQAVLEITLLSGQLSATSIDRSSIDRTSQGWELFIILYVIPHGDAPTVIPFHTSECLISFGDWGPRTSTSVSLFVIGPAVKSGQNRSEVAIESASRVEVRAKFSSVFDPARVEVDSVQVSLRLGLVHSDRSAHVSAVMERTLGRALGGGKEAEWRTARPRPQPHASAFADGNDVARHLPQDHSDIGLHLFERKQFEYSLEHEMLQAHLLEQAIQRGIPRGFQNARLYLTGRYIDGADPSGARIWEATTDVGDIFMLKNITI